MAQTDLEKLIRQEAELIKKKKKLKDELNTLDKKIDDLKEEIWRQSLNQVVLKVGPIKKVDAKEISNMISLKSYEELKIPAEFSSTLTNEKKVIYAVSILKEATVKEISNYLEKLLPEVDPKAVYRMVQQVINKLKKEFRIKGTEEYNAKYKLMV